MEHSIQEHLLQLCRQFNLDFPNLLAQLRLENHFTAYLPPKVRIGRSIFLYKLRVQMIEIQELAQENNIKMFFFKGLVEAYDLYDSFYHRNFNDIDILISPSDVLKFLAICKDKGYSFIDREIDEDTIREQISQNCIYHVPPIIKKGDKNYIPIEVHFAFDTLWFSDPIPVERMLNDLETCEIDGYDFYVPCIEDRLIILLHHFGRHFMGEFGAIVYSKNKTLFHTKTLYDATLFYMKYLNNLDYEKIILLTEQYGFKYEVLVSVGIIQILFGVDMKELRAIAKLPDPVNHFWPNHIFKAVLEQLRIELILEQSGKLFYQAVVSKCIDENALTYLCTKKENAPNMICIDEHSESVTKNRFGTICRCGLYPSSSKECSAYASLQWDEKHLYFNLFFSSESYQFYNENDLNAVGSTIALVLYNPHFDLWEKSVLGIHIVPVISKNGEVYLRFEYCGEWDDPRVQAGGTIPKFEDVEYVVKAHSQGFDIHVKFEWALLDIDVEQTNYLGMELIVNHTKMKETQLNAILAWANMMPNYYGPEKFGKLYLSE